MARTNPELPRNKLGRIYSYIPERVKELSLIFNHVVIYPFICLICVGCQYVYVLMFIVQHLPL